MRLRKRYGVRNSHLRRYIILAALIFLGVILLKIGNKSYWDGKSRFTIIIQNLDLQNTNINSNLSVLSFEPAQNRAIILTIPNNSLLNVPFGYETYPAASVFKLGELDVKRGGGVLLSRTIEETLGIAVDKYLVYESRQIEIPHSRSDVQNIKNRISNLSGIIKYTFGRILGRGNISTNISYLDALKIWNSVRKLRIDQIKLVNLENSFITREIELADGSLAHKIELELFDYLVRENLTDTAIRSENIAVEIVNATNTERVAGQMARVLSHLGSHVLVKSTSDKVQNEACLVTSYIPDKIKVTLLGFLTKHYKCKINYSQNNEAKTDIKIVLGEGILQ